VAAGLNFLVPGSAQVLAGSRRLGRVGLTATLIMWVGVVVAAVAALVWPTLLFTLGTNAAACSPCSWCSWRTPCCGSC
jgi:hypothetical protein